MSEPSVAVEVTVRVKSASESAGGVMVRPERLALGQGPGAVAVVGTSRQAGAGGHAGDDDRQALGAVGVGQRRGDIECDRGVFVARDVVGGDGRRIGHGADRDVEGIDGLSRVRAIGRGRGDRQGEVGV